MIPNVVRGGGFRGALEYILATGADAIAADTAPDRESDGESDREADREFDNEAALEAASESDLAAALADDDTPAPDPADVADNELLPKQSKQPTIIASNMAGQTARTLATEFGVVRQRNRRCKNPVWHVSLSFAIEDTPTEEQLERIPALFIDKVGAQAGEGERGINSDANQWIAVAHHNTDHLHIHLLLNRINYDGEVCYCKWDKNLSQAACREIEQELGLVEVKGDSERLFLDGRLIAHLEKEEQKTGIADPRLERYRQEQQQSLEASHGRRRAKQAAALRATAGSVPDRDSIGIASAGVRNSTRDAAPATAPDPGLEPFEQPFERALQAHLDRLLGPAAAASCQPGDLQNHSDHGLQLDRGGVQPVHSGVPGGEQTVESRNRQPASPSAGAGGGDRQSAKPAPEERTVRVKPVRPPKAPSVDER